MGASAALDRAWGLPAGVGAAAVAGAGAGAGGASAFPGSQVPGEPSLWAGVGPCSRATLSHQREGAFHRGIESDDALHRALS
eukprot:5812996-Pyramimonas_sp.AAC.1